MRAFYWTVRHTCRASLAVVYRHRTFGVENIPHGGALLAANHCSFLDSICIGASASCELHWLGDDWLFRIPLLASVLRGLNTLPVGFEHGSLSNSSLLRARRVLRAGGKIVVYPEARRSADGRVSGFHDGAVRLARAARVPLVPVWVGGTWEAWPPHRRLPRLWGGLRTCVAFGAPLPVALVAAEGTPASQVAAQLRDAVLELARQYRDTVAV